MRTNQGLGRKRSLVSFCFGLFHICLVIPIRKYKRSWSAIKITTDASFCQLAKGPVLISSRKQCQLVDFQLNLKQPFYRNTKIFMERVRFVEKSRKHASDFSPKALQGHANAELEDILNKCRVLGDITLTKIFYKASLSKTGKFKEICSIRFHMYTRCRLCDYPAWGGTISWSNTWPGRDKSRYLFLSKSLFQRRPWHHRAKHWVGYHQRQTSKCLLFLLSR